MSQLALDNPSTLATLYLGIKTPCPRCPMSQSKQTQFPRGRFIVPNASVERSGARFNLSAKCRKCPESGKPYSRQMKISHLNVSCPKPTEQHSNFKSTERYSSRKKKTYVAHVPAVPSHKPTDRKYISKTRKIKFMSPPSQSQNASVLQQQPYTE